MIAQLPSFDKNKQKKKKNDTKEKENLDSNEDSTTDDETGFLIRRMPEINVSSSSDEDYSTSNTDVPQQCGRLVQCVELVNSLGYI